MPHLYILGDFVTHGAFVLLDHWTFTLFDGPQPITRFHFPHGYPST